MNRLQPDWLTENDDHILELLGETGVALNKRGLEVNLELRDTPVSYSTIKRRVDKLDEVGFVEDIGETGSYYRISERGRRYLTGDPYGTSDVTEGVEPISVDPIDYKILQEIKGAEVELDDEDVLARITVDRRRASERLSELKSKHVIQEGDSGLELALVGIVILGSFREGKEVTSRVKMRPDAEFEVDLQRGDVSE